MGDWGAEGGRRQGLKITPQIISVKNREVGRLTGVAW